MKAPQILSQAEAKKLNCLIVDSEPSTLEALVEFDHPGVRDQKKVAELAKKQELPQMATVYYPWLNKAVKLPPKEIFRQIRSSRNRNLINDDEQRRLGDFCVGIAGMSVGSNIASALFIEGISVAKIKLADADELSLPNLNRIRSGVAHIGRLKVEVIAEQLYELDPYSHIVTFTEGVNQKNIADFFDGCKLIVDEVDDLEMKIRIRLAARQRRVPVVMVTDIDHRALLDVERYDLDADYPIFHGRAGEVTLDTIKNGVTNEMRVKLSTSIVGEENLTERMKSSVAEIGKTLPTWPQLGPAAFMAGTVAAYAVKEICLGSNLSGRWRVGLDEIIGAES